ncbi:MAG TPA: AAA family ATPase [Pyrinomonadaceae bacterium]|nr:AAA family ATPase [Pyrinomonadaceae bacterium]
MFLIETNDDSETTKMQLILDKIAMPSPSPGISRPRLLGLLDKSLASCTSTVISGRAGTGKTKLAVEFARKCGRSIAWYKVDTPDGELPVFFEYLAGSIQNQLPDFNRQPLVQLVGRMGPDSISRLAEAFIYQLLQCELKPIVVVIEDLHLVCDSNWVVPFFHRLLPLLPPEVHMLITSRTMPPAPLWRMRSKQTLSVIDEDALAFTKGEALDLFGCYGLTSQQASIALDHTHGRAAALDNFAASLCKSEKTAALA